MAGSLPVCESDRWSPERCPDLATVWDEEEGLWLCEECDVFFDWFAANYTALMVVSVPLGYLDQ